MFYCVASSTKATKKKLPAGAVSIFGSAGLFSPEEEKSVTFDDQSTVISEVSYSLEYCCTINRLITQ